MKMTRDMTTGSPLKSILRFCVPLLIGNLFQQFYNLADSILVGRILGVRSFAAVGATGALSFLILGFALGICSGFAIPIAQSFGAGDMETVRSRAGQTVWLGVIFTALITGITFFWTDEILRLTRTPDPMLWISREERTQRTCRDCRMPAGSAPSGRNWRRSAMPSRGHSARWMKRAKR